MDDLELRRTRPYADFKKAAGHNNHFLITILVGLDAVQSGHAQKRPTFSTTWEPRDVASSAARSRAYAINTSLVWISDLVHTYWHETIKLPGVCAESDVDYVLGNGQDGKSRQLGRYARRLGIGVTPELSLVQIAHHWRNKVAHSSASGQVNSEVRGSLLRAATEIATGYNGLNVQELIEHEKAGRSPTFKEIASLIHASHRLVDDLDRAVRVRVDVQALMDQLLADYLRSGTQSEWNTRSQSLWTGDTNRAERRIRGVLAAWGFHSAAVSDRSPTPTEKHLTGLAALSLEQARTTFPWPTPTDGQQGAVNCL